MPPYRDLDKGNLIGAVLGNYRDIQRKYGDALVEESLAKNRQVATLDAEARDIAQAGAREVTRIRAEGEKRVREVQLDAEKRVSQLDERRLQCLADHHAALRTLQERTEQERASTDQKVCDIEEETEALFSAAEARIAAIGRERDAATRANHERAAAAAGRGEARAKQAELQEARLIEAAQAAVKDVERRCADKVKEIETRGDTWQRHHEELIRTWQRSLAEQVEQLCSESWASRRNLAQNRTRADQHLHADLSKQREATAAAIREQHLAVEAARGEQRAANDVASETFDSLVRDCKAQKGEHIMEVNAASEALHQVIHVMAWRDRVNQDRYEQIAELAEKLRSGNILWSAPPVPLTAVQNVPPEALTEPRPLMRMASAGK